MFDTSSHTIMRYCTEGENICIINYLIFFLFFPSCRTLYSLHCTLHRTGNSTRYDQHWHTLGFLPCSQCSSLPSIRNKQQESAITDPLLPLPSIIQCHWPFPIMEVQATMVGSTTIWWVNNHHHFLLPLHSALP